MRNDRLITYRQTSSVKLKCRLNLADLYPTSTDKKAFKKRLDDFLESHPDNKDIYQLEGNRLNFESEQLIPNQPDKKDRLPLLLVFGNPASHSVKQGMFFSFEGNGKEHRFWKDIMKPSLILDLSQDLEMPIKKRNQSRKRRLLNLDYESPFRIGLCVFVSFPSGPSGPWSGIAGINKLFGAQAMKQLEPYERERVLKAAKQFLNNQGVVATFQKNAWEGLRGDQDPHFSVYLAKEGKLVGRLNGMPEIHLYGIPPTRLSGHCRRVLMEKMNGK